MGYSCVHHPTGSYCPCSFTVGSALTLLFVWSGLEGKLCFCDFCHQSCNCPLLSNTWKAQGFPDPQLLILANLAPPLAEFRVYPDLPGLWYHHCRAKLCFHSCPWVFSNTLLTLGSRSSCSEDTGYPHTAPPWCCHTPAHKLAFASWCQA